MPEFAARHQAEPVPQAHEPDPEPVVTPAPAIEVARETDADRLRRILARNAETTPTSEPPPEDLDTVRHHSLIEGAAPQRMARLAPAWDEARPKPSEMGAWTWTDGAWHATAPRDGIAPPVWTRPPIDGDARGQRLPLDAALMMQLAKSDVGTAHVSPGVAAAVAAAIGRGELGDARDIAGVTPLMQQMTASRTLDPSMGADALAARDGVPELALAAKVDLRPSSHFAFDGTRNHGLSEGNYGGSNVYAAHRLRRVHADDGENEFAHYYPGPGNDVDNGAVGYVVGGATGVGGGSALDRALEDMKKDYAAGIRVADISGFSRGAALVPEFMHRVIEWQDEERRTGKHVEPIEFRFVGLYDTVPATGLANNDINLGLRFDLPHGEYAPKYMVHVIAGAETRDLFQVTDVGSVYDDNLVKPIYNVVHSDAGGGYKHKGLSNIVLHDMIEHMQRAGVPIDSLEERVAQGDAKFSRFLHQDPYMIPHKEESIVYTQVDRLLPTDVSRDETLGSGWSPPSIIREEVAPRRSPKGGIADRNGSHRVFSRRFADPRETRDEDEDYLRYAPHEVP